MSLYWFLAAAHAVALPCDGYTPPANPPAASQACDDINAPDLAVGSVGRCAEDCAAGITVWVPVHNIGTADAGPFDVVFARRTPTSLSEIQVESIAGLAMGDQVVLGPFTFDSRTWGANSIEVRLDARNTVAECDEEGVVNLGSFDPPPVDADGDGYRSPECGGKDCNDEDASIAPGATEIRGDEIDQDCDGDDMPLACDVDGDGAESTRCGGEDCNDADAGIGPGVTEIGNDFIDQDCDGLDKCVGGVWAEGGLGCATSGGSPLWLLGLLAFAGRRRQGVRP